MKKKILFIANSDRHILLCHVPYLKMFKDNGYIVHVATNTNKKIKYCDKKIFLPLTRKPYNIKNICALKQIRQLVKKENYDIISCHTPMGGFLGRMSVIGKKNKPKVFYTAHGFHFYKGSPIFYWLIYYPIEKYLSKHTTCILTMNEEDYKLAKNKFHCDVYKINGIGFDSERLKEKIKINDYKNSFVVTYVAEISKRKRQIELIEKLKKVDLEKENIKVLLIGDSTIKDFQKYVSKNIMYIDFKENIGDYLRISDLVISASKQEGLPLNIVEAMSLNKMIIATNIRGNRDLIHNKKNGILVDSLDSLVQEILKYKNNPNYIIDNNMDKYKIENVIVEVKKIYNNYLENNLK